METDRLRQFKAVVETGSLTQAADLLGVTPGGLSKSMKILQAELGQELIRPEGRGLVVTDQGLEVYRRLIPVLEAVQKLQEPDTEHAQTLKVGGLEVFTFEFLGRVLTGLFPDAELEILDLGSGHIEAAVLQKKIDVGLTYFPRPQEGLDYLKIKDIDLKVYAAWGSEDACSLESLRFVAPLSPDSPDITDPYDSDGWPELKYPRNKALRTNRLSTAINSVVSDDYAIFIPQFFADHINRQLPKAKQLRPVRLKQKIGKITRSIFMVKRKSRSETSQMKQLARAIRQEC